VVVDIVGAELGMPAGRVPLSGGPVSQVRVGQFTPDVVRVVVELVQPVRVSLTPSPDGSALVVGIPARGAIGQTTAIAPGPSSSVRDRIAKVTGITLWGTASKPWVSISASGPVRYERRNIQPDWVVVDVSKAQLALASGKLPVGRGLVKQIHARQFASDIVRVVLELAQPAPIHVATSTDRAVIVVSFLAEARTRPGSTQAQGNDRAPALSTQQPVISAPPAVAAPFVASAPPVISAPPAAGPSASVEKPVASPPPAPTRLGPPGSGGYLLGPEDVLEITVWGHSDLTRVVPVRPDGQVAVPLAGTLPASGRSVESLTEDLTRAFTKYIVNPQVTVIVKEFRKVRVSVLGQVAHPGTFTLPPGARVLDAVSIASGVNDNAALNQVQLVRASGENRPLSLEGLLLQQDMRQNLVLEPGDTILIPEDTKNKFYVVGDVNHAGVFPLKGEVTVLEALAAAGGPVLHGTSTSDTVHIVRRVDPAQGPLMASAQRADVQPIANSKGVLVSMDLHKMMGGDLRQNEALRPGDVIVVPAPGIAALPTILSLIPFLFWLR
jgi:polysaccharide export outer membrane protein